MNKLKEAVLSILSKSSSFSTVTAEFSSEELFELEFLIKSIDKKTSTKRHDAPNPDVKVKEILKTDKNGQWNLNKEEKVYGRVKVQMDSDTYDKPGKHNPDLASPGNSGGGKLRKTWTDNAQWSLSKAIKPGPTLNYGKINPQDNPISNPKEAAAAKQQKYNDIDSKAPTINYSSDNGVTKPKWSGAADRTAAVRSKIDTEANETAVDTFKRRGQTAKNEGVNLEPELTSEQKKRMVNKNEMLGAGAVDGSAGVMQSEKEPHKHDSKHEEKEQTKAKKIKKEAESLLDMHKLK